MHRLLLVGFEGVQTLDFTGPAEVFAAANRERAEALYELLYLSPEGGAVTTSAGLRVETRALRSVRLALEDTVLVAGGEERAITEALRARALLPFLRRAREKVRRLGSVCSGAFLLAAAGVLDGLTVATHWSATERLAKFRPALRVDREAIFVRNGTLWTSAGVTTGIDMALAMIEEDHGRALADAVASRLVLYLRRPGFQTQFTDALVSETDAGQSLAAALRWARSHLREADVPTLARRAALSERSLHRRCRELFERTPREVLERLRVEHARTLLPRKLSQKELARRCGFRSVEQLRHAFERVLGLTPRAWSALFAGTTP